MSNPKYKNTEQIVSAFLDKELTLGTIQSTIYYYRNSGKFDKEKMFRDALTVCKKISKFEEMRNTISLYDKLKTETGFYMFLLDDCWLETTV